MRFAAVPSCTAVSCCSMPFTERNSAQVNREGIGSVPHLRKYQLCLFRREGVVNRSLQGGRREIDLCRLKHSFLPKMCTILCTLNLVLNKIFSFSQNFELATTLRRF